MPCIVKGFCFLVFFACPLAVTLFSSHNLGFLVLFLTGIVRVFLSPPVRVNLCQT